MISQPDLTALYVTLQLAAVTTLILLVVGTPIAWWLANTRWRFKFCVEAVVALPLVLPPTVLGFYLLVALGPHGPIGGLTSAVGLGPLAFTFTGLVIGSVVYSLPFVVQPLQNAFVGVGRRPLEVAATLRASFSDRFLTVMLPLAWPGFLTAATLGFAHTLGEFGVVLMIGGNIPDSTRVVSIAIYDHVALREYADAYRLSAALLILSFLLLAAVYVLNRRMIVVQR